MQPFFDVLVRYETELWAMVDARLSTAGTVSLATLEALRVVDRHTGRCRVHEVSADLSITVGAASKLVDRIELAGLVRREPNPQDRRSALVLLTPAGAEALAFADEVACRALGEHLNSSGVDVAALTKGLTVLRERLTVARRQEAAA
ncbi:MarR family winged helix-turn-helix transcriptional regulator [Myceligenerans salitolerans]|uniref:MarR family transcriptional regulator n=1 Tax=Myceligenerans salitolerans TaxID=1230528 RepID=A0ABS3IBD9_9MICO|nr:MarR family transcriptional regulator [Myceligenerans salitolerans]MBO0610356.1 MarR family transcriptional regulator [Myceligenerans salitolerans]